MSEEIIKVLNALAEKFGLAVDWTSSNVIPYLEQLCGKYVTYEIATSIVWLLIGIGCLILSKFMLKKTKFYFKDADWEYGNTDMWLCIIFAIGFGIALLIGVIMPIYQVFDIVTCFTFPEKIIIEELKSIYTNLNYN